MDEIDQIINMLLDYNQQTLSKNEVDEEVARLYEEKAEIVENSWNEIDPDDRRLNREDFARIMEKIKAKKKGVYTDLINGGGKFHDAIFTALARIFASGEVPDSFRTTFLTKIFKKKGSMKVISNYRFVHGKDFLPKLCEKLVVDKIESKVRENTSSTQIGGIPRKSTRDHLLACLLSMRHFQRIGKPVILLLLDISKCFDKIKLSDMLFEALQLGCKPAIVKYLEKLSENTVIKMRGMGRDELSRIVVDTVGQGTDFAVLLTSFSIGLILEKFIKDQVSDEWLDNIQVGDFRVPPFAFVDDINALCPDMEAMGNLATNITKALNYISLKANQTKTKVMIVGNTGEAKKIRMNYGNSTPKIKIQGNDIDTSEVESYLGFILDQNGVKASIKRTIDDRANKAWGKIFMLKRIANHPAMQSIGFVKTSVTLFKACIIPTIMYSSECWIEMTKGTQKDLEKKYRKMLCSMLDIPHTAKYGAVLSELDLLKAENIVDISQASYLNKLINRQCGTDILWKLLDKDNDDIVRHNNKVSRWKNPTYKMSVKAHLASICNKYDIPNPNECRMSSEHIKCVIKNKAKIDIWREASEGKLNIKRSHYKVKHKPYHEMPKRTGRAILLWRVGMLRFRGNWRVFNLSKNLSVDCPHPLCGEVDTFVHAVECPFMNTKMGDRDENVAEDVRVFRFLYFLNKERMKFQRPIL